MFELQSTSVEATRAYGEALASCVQPDDMVVLTGDLGAGKTHFSQGFAAGLGVAEGITSPTFNIVIEYESGRLPLLHFDLYRLESEEELEDIDWYGLTESGSASLVEWGDKFPAALPDDYLLINISTDLEGLRTLRIEGRGTRGQELEEAFARVATETGSLPN